MNVSIQHSTDQSSHPPKKVLVAERDFAAGDVIYKETPMVAALDADLEGQGTHCSYCFRQIQKGMAIVPESDKLGSVYCSKDCQVKANLSWQNMLFGLEPVDSDPALSALLTEDRAKAQEAYLEWIRAKGKDSNVLAARFIAKHLAFAMEKVTMKLDKAGPLQAELDRIADSDQYSAPDHIERLRFLEGNVTDEEIKLLRDVLSTALPGAEQALAEQRHAILVGKMKYNAIGVCPGGGRDDRPAPTERPEDQERTRTPYGTSRQLGSGLYIVSSYLAHSCDPSTRPSFSAGTNELHLTATRAIKKGEELTTAYVDIAQRSDESSEDARRRRRAELARGWKFKCECARCLSEVVADLAQEDAALGVQGDESKVEDVMRHETPGSGASATAGPVSAGID